MDRRKFLMTGAATAGLVVTGAGWRRPVVAAPGDPLPPLAWVPTALAPALSHFHRPSDLESQWNHTSLLPAGALLGSAAIDEWYLFRWTHDTSHIYLYTAPAITGPFTLHGFSDAPTPYPAGYIANHFSSGDIVWDAANSRFVASPHGVENYIRPGNAEPCQPSFLISSADGVTWQWLDGDNRPRLLCGGPGTPDGIHTGYGRLLRDIDGKITTHNGRYWWIYRAQRLDVGQAPLAPTFRAFGTTYTPYLASAATLSSDFDQKQKAFDSLTFNYGLNGFGCFVQTGGSHHTYFGSALPDPPIAPVKTLHYRTQGDSMAFDPVPLVPVMYPGVKGTIIEDATIIRDPADGAVYVCHTQAYLNPDPTVSATVEVWIYRGVALV